MGGMPEAGKTRSALLSSMLSEGDADDPLCCVGWGAVLAAPLVVCCSCGWLSQVGAEASAPDRVALKPVHRKWGSQFEAVAM